LSFPPHDQSIALTPQARAALLSTRAISVLVPQS